MKQGPSTQLDTKMLVHQNLSLCAQLQAYKSKLASLNAQTPPSVEEIEAQNHRLKRRLVLLGQYDPNQVQNVLKETQSHLCYCGGLHLQARSKQLQEVLANQRIIHEAMQQESARPKQTGMQVETKNEEGTRGPESLELQAENKVLMEKLVSANKKIQHCKVHHQISSQMVRESDAYRTLKKQNQSLIVFVSECMGKLKNHKDNVAAIQKQHRQEIARMVDKANQPRLSIRRESILNNSKLDKQLHGVKVELQKMTDFRPKFKKFISKYKQKIKGIEHYKNQIKVLQAQKEQSFSKKTFDSLQSSNLRSLIHKVLYQQSIQSFLREPWVTRNQWNEFWQYALYLEEEVNQLRTQLTMKEDEQIKMVEAFDAWVGDSEQLFSSINQHMASIQTKVIDLEFKFGESRANQVFDKAQTQEQIASLQEQLQQWRNHEAILRQCVSDRKQIQAAFDENMKAKRKAEGELQGKNMQLKTAESSWNLSAEVYTQRLNKLTQDKTKLKHESDLLKSKAQHTGETIVQDQSLLAEIDYYRRKVACRCDGLREVSVLIDSCKHLVCEKCMDIATKNRRRMCPVCNSKFAKEQIHHFRFSDP